MTQTCLFIWRFQPAHYGTVDAIEQIIAAGYTHILFGIGSGDKEFTPDNPLTYTERKKVLSSIIQEKFPSIEASYATIPDFGDNVQRFDYIVKNLPSFDAIASGNDRTKDIFSSRGYAIVSLEIRKIVKASNIRNFIKKGEWENVTSLIPGNAIQELKSLNLTERLRTISPPEKKSVIIQLSATQGWKTHLCELNPDKTILDNLRNLVAIYWNTLPEATITENLSEYEHIYTLHYYF